MKPLIAYHGQQSIKDKYLARVEAHKAADEITSGRYWEGGMGCAVGCTIHGSDHAKYETAIGVPRVLARLEDRLFEGVYQQFPTDAKEWPGKFLAAIRPGADLSMVWPKFALWMLIDAESGVIRFAKSERSKTAIQNVASLYQEWVGGSKPSVERWNAAAYAAAAHAAHAAYAAANAYADAAHAAYAAADAYAAAYAYAANARSIHYKVMAEKLIALLAEA